MLEDFKRRRCRDRPVGFVPHKFLGEQILAVFSGPRKGHSVIAHEPRKEAITSGKVQQRRIAVEARGQHAGQNAHHPQVAADQVHVLCRNRVGIRLVQPVGTLGLKGAAIVTEMLGNIVFRQQLAGKAGMRAGPANPAEAFVNRPRHRMGV